jgi:hypothetical protein
MGRGIGRANLQLYRLEVFLPNLFADEDNDEEYNDIQEDITNIVEAIYPKKLLSATGVQIRTGYNIALNGEDFWSGG